MKTWMAWSPVLIGLVSRVAQASQGDLPYVLGSHADRIAAALTAWDIGFSRSTVAYHPEHDELTIDLQQPGLCWIARFYLPQKSPGERARRPFSRRTFIFEAEDSRGSSRVYTFPASSAAHELMDLGLTGLATAATGGIFAAPNIFIMGGSYGATTSLGSKALQFTDAYHFMTANIPKERKRAIGDMITLLRELVIAADRPKSIDPHDVAREIKTLCSKHR